MPQPTCKRIWEGAVGVVMSPRKKHNGEYFWSFSFVRAFRRTRGARWEYVHDFGEQHATALGLLMSKAFHFMRENDPARFLEGAMNAPEVAVATPEPEKPLPPARAAA